MINLAWPVEADADLHQSVHRVLAAVVELGGAVGWLHVPDESECAGWFEAELALARAGRGGVCCLSVDGELAALAVWGRFSAPVVAQNAEVRKVMVAPQFRGRGLGRVVLEAVREHAAAAGVEHLVLDVRGNNHGAQRLYESLGWERVGVLPDFIAVGEHRFDRVLYRLPLQLPADTVRHGSAPTGPGASPLR